MKFDSKIIFSFILLSILLPSIVTKADTFPASEKGDAITEKKPESEEKRESQESADSIASTTLDEVIVKGEKTWIEDGKIISIPTKNEKRLSNSAATLIQSMNLTYLKGTDGKIETPDGRPVAVFINGIRAQETDLATFWPKNALRVEFLRNPEDPRFDGEPLAVNFIMADYSIGGVSKAEVLQVIPNRGNYKISSKFAYRSMTFGVMAFYDYSRNHSDEISGDASYNDIYYDDTFHARLMRKESRRPYSRSDGSGVSVNARHLTDKSIITHTVSLNWKRDPGSGYTGESAWSDNIFGGSTDESYSKSRSLSPQITGYYNFDITDRWNLSGGWGYFHSSERDYTRNRTGYTEPLVNFMRENTDELSFTVSPAFRLSRNWAFRLSVSSTLDWYRTHYEGTADTASDMFRQESSGSLNIRYTNGSNLNLSLEPAVNVSSWEAGGVKEYSTRFEPRFSVMWTPSRKISLSLWSNYWTFPPKAYEINPVLTQVSELEWDRGNPALRSASSWTAMFNLLYMAKGWVNLSVDADYTLRSNFIISSYTAASREMGGLIHESVNAGDGHQINLRVPVGFYLMGGRLNLQVTPWWIYNRNSGGTYRNYSGSRIEGSVSYIFRNVRIGASGSSGYTTLGDGGVSKVKHPPFYALSVAYGNGDFYLYAKLENFFNKRTTTTAEYNYGAYSCSQQIRNVGRCLSIVFSYTIGYGKKTDRYIDIDAPKEIESSVRNK